VSGAHRAERAPRDGDPAGGDAAAGGEASPGRAAASIVVPGLHPAALPPEVLLGQCEQTARRRSGPGGQHRNKVETGVVLVHEPTGIEGQASERRSRPQNAAAALFRLRVQLALDVRSARAEVVTPDEAVTRAAPVAPTAPAARGEPVRPTSARPSALWHSRCRGGRITVSGEHEDFPALLAEALDAVHAQSFDVSAAAAALGASATQLVRLLAQEPRALIAVNAARAARGLHPMRG
jgi:RF-1 domain